MTAEYLAAIGSLAGAVIIGGTAIAALIQLRHMHQANSSNAMLTLRAIFDDERHSAARNAVRRGAADEAMRDPGFRRYVASFAAHGPPAPESAGYAELLDYFAILGNTFETIGTMVKQGTIDQTEFLDLYSFVIETSWRRLETYIAYTRAFPGNGDSLFENFEYLTVLALDWRTRHPSSYPHNVRRLPLTNAYPVEFDETPAPQVASESADRTSPTAGSEKSTGGMNSTIATMEGSEGLARLAHALGRAAGRVVGDETVEVVLEAPRSFAFGDFATNVALQLAKRARRPPQHLATEIAASLFDDDPDLRAIVAGATPLAGFINLRMTPAYWQRALAQILRQGAEYGRGAPQGRHVSLEFGSANPTGPLVVVQGRTLSLGDSLAKAMRFCGLEVTTEWIVNDAGSQVETLGRSLYARYRQLTEPAFPFPEDGYPGPYLVPIAERIRADDGDVWASRPETEWLPHFARFGRDTIVLEQQETSHRFRVTFDRWQSEKELHASGAIEGAIARLRERDLVFEADGALWMRATAFGDDKDRVVVRSDGRPTYYGADLAYHYDKLERTDHATLILGPDHHGYIARLRLIADLLGRPGAIDVMLAQQMTTVRDGQVVSLSKRHGDILTLDEVLDEVGIDAARFFFAASNADSPMTFDLTLAKEQSNENPVYYVQYGHARIASIERKAAADLLAHAGRGESLERLVAPEELALARRLAEFPATVRSVVDGLAPNRLARYARDVASDFHQFYMACTVLGDDRELSVARLGLARATKLVLATALGLLGVGAPDRMDRD